MGLAHNGGMKPTTRYLLISVVCVLAILAWISGVTRVFGQRFEISSATAAKWATVGAGQEAKPADVPRAEAKLPTPKPVTDLEARKIRELQLAIAETQNRLLQLERQFKTEQANLQTATKELDSYLDSLQVKYAAKDYDLDQQLAWQKKKK
jgi:hypothetical protein